MKTGPSADLGVTTRERECFDLSTYRRPYVSATQLAQHLDVDRRTIVRLIREHSLPGIKVGRCWRIPTEAARVMFHAA